MYLETNLYTESLLDIIANCLLFPWQSYKPNPPSLTGISLMIFNVSLANNGGMVPLIEPLDSIRVERPSLPIISNKTSITLESKSL